MSLLVSIHGALPKARRSALNFFAQAHRDSRSRSKRRVPVNSPGCAVRGSRCPLICSRDPATRRSRGSDREGHQAQLWMASPGALDLEALWRLGVRFDRCACSREETSVAAMKAGIEGAYVLAGVSSRRRNPGPYFGRCPCRVSQWPYHVYCSRSSARIQENRGRRLWRVHVGAREVFVWLRRLDRGYANGRRKRRFRTCRGKT
jgi:hypothetical protein